MGLWPMSPRCFSLAACDLYFEEITVAGRSYLVRRG